MNALGCPVVGIGLLICGRRPCSFAKKLHTYLSTYLKLCLLYVGYLLVEKIRFSLYIAGKVVSNKRCWMRCTRMCMALCIVHTYTITHTHRYLPTCTYFYFSRLSAQYRSLWLRDCLYVFFCQQIYLTSSYPLIYEYVGNVASIESVTYSRLA